MKEQREVKLVGLTSAPTNYGLILLLNVNVDSKFTI